MHRPGSRAFSVEALKKQLQKEPSVFFGYLYGSFLTRRDPRDIDIAVYLKKPKDPWRKTQAIGAHLEKSLGCKIPVDVHSLNNAVPAFAFEVMKRGKLLIDKNHQARLVWEAHTLSLYQDMKPMLDFFDRKLLLR